MAQIIEYVNRENIQPTDRGTEARVQEGRRIGAAYNQVADTVANTGARVGQEIGGGVRDLGDAAVQYQTHREISQGVASFALMQNDMINQWNATAKNADPNDPSVQQKFIDKTLNPALQTWADAFKTEGGQKFATEHQSMLLNHLYEKSSADMGTLAAQAVATNVRVTGNTLANTAMADPSSVDHLLGQVDASLGALVSSAPNMRAPQAGQVTTELSEHVKEGIVKAGAMAAIKQSTDPEKTADDWSKKYPQYITPDEAHTLALNARAQIRARDYDSRSAIAAKKEADREQSNDAANNYLTDIFSKDPRVVADTTAQKILNDPKLQPHDRVWLLNMRERELKPETDARISAQTFTTLLGQLYQPGADIGGIERAARDARLKNAGQAGSLTQTDFDRIRKEIVDRRTPEGEALGKDRSDFFQRYTATIDPQRDKATGAGGTALGDQKIYQAYRDAQAAEARLRAQGKDPREIYDPNSPLFFGRNIGRYRPTMTEINEFDAQAQADKARTREGQPGPPPGAVTPPRSDSWSSFWGVFGGGNPAADAARGASTTAPTAPPSSMPSVRSREEYDKLAPGAEFRGADGNTYRKPKGENRVPTSQ